jgi:hypothetical protein
VIKKHRERGGHSPRLAAEPEKINGKYEDFNPLTAELNPSTPRCLPRFFTVDFNC